MKRNGLILSLGGLSALAILVILGFTNPTQVGPLGILAFFVFLYLLVTSLIYFLMLAIRYVLRKILRPGRWLLSAQQLQNVKVYYYASMLALVPVIVLGMQSVGGAKLLDLLLIGLFEVLAIFYIQKRF
ncbi:hypothetical protein CR969_03535 [Candidatus Saccharibacteria bacterium]|nr:MAG: hypothetical protein CR969_03535 [Candidatus Saccharibacteria bacterium]